MLETTLRPAAHEYGYFRFTSFYAGKAYCRLTKEQVSLSSAQRCAQSSFEIRASAANAAEAFFTFLSSSEEFSWSSY